MCNKTQRTWQHYSLVNNGNIFLTRDYKFLLKFRFYEQNEWLKVLSCIFNTCEKSIMILTCRFFSVGEPKRVESVKGLPNFQTDTENNVILYNSPLKSK